MKYHQTALLYRLKLVRSPFIMFITSDTLQRYAYVHSIWFAAQVISAGTYYIRVAYDLCRTPCRIIYNIFLNYL